jgi:hypothetical protein
VWTIGEDGLIAQSRGHFDEADYRRQLQHGARKMDENAAIFVMPWN